jgi:hypothetical protein
MAVLREIQTADNVLTFYTTPPAPILLASVKQQTIATGKPPQPLEYLVVLSKHELRAYDCSVVPVTIAEQTAIVAEIVKDGAITTVPKVIADAKYNELPKAEPAKELEDKTTQVADSLEPPKITKVTLVTDLITSSAFFSELSKADAAYCSLATKTLKIPRTQAMIGTPLEDDWWPFKNGPNAKVAIRKPPAVQPAPVKVGG